MAFAVVNLPLIHLPTQWTIWGMSDSVATVQENNKPIAVKNTTMEESARVTFSVEENQPLENTTPLPVQHRKLSWEALLLGAYGLGTVAMLLRFLLQCGSLFKLYRQARLERRVGYKLAICKQDLKPFAFWRTIFVPQDLVETEQFPLVLTHELAHVQQKHSWDILLAEWLLIWQWFNPGAWLYRRLVETNLEYLADRSVLEQKWNKKQYQLSLLQWTNPHPGNSLANTYHFSPLKERIRMMNRKPSPKAYIFRYALTGLLLPCLLCFNRPTPMPQEPEARSVGTPQKSTPLDAAPKTVVVLPISSKPGQKPNTNPTRRSALQDTTPQQEDVLSFILLLNPNLNPQLQEKLGKEKWPMVKNLELTKSESGRIIGVTVTHAIGGSFSATSSGNNDLPIAIYVYEKGGGGIGGLTNTLVDQLVSGSLQKTTKVIAYDVPLDPTGLEAYRAKIAAQGLLEDKRQLEKLAATQWVSTDSRGSTGYRIPVQPEVWEGIRQRIQTYIDANKPYQVVLNGLTFQSNMPQIDLSKIKKMTLYESAKTEYFEGTLRVKKTELNDVRLEIELE